MQYQSPIRLFIHCGIDYENSDIVRIKKIITAEFAASETGVIIIDGFTYTKNDISRLFDNNRIEDCISNDKFIWQRKILLDCLERNTVDAKELTEWSKLLSEIQNSNPALIHYISPYLAIAFNNVMRKFLYPTNFVHAAKWLGTLSIIDNIEDRNTALISTRIFIEDFTKALRNVNKDTYTDIFPQTYTWSAGPWYDLINNLPEDFKPVKDKLLRTLVDFTAMIWEKDVQLCYNLSLRMTKVKGLESELERTIKKNHRILLATQHEEAQKKAGSGWGSLAILSVFVGLLITFFILVFSSDNNNQERNTRIRLTEKNFTALDLYRYVIKSNAIDSTLFEGFINKDIHTTTAAPYYLIFEKKAPAFNPGFIVNVVNNSSHTINIYTMKSARDEFFKVSFLTHDIGASETLEVQSNINTLNLFINYDINKAEEIRPVLISDSLNLTKHTLNKGTAVYNGSPREGSKPSFEILIYDLTEPDSIGITFSNAEWIR